MDFYDEVQMDENGNYIVPPEKMNEVLEHMALLNEKVDEMRVIMEDKISDLKNENDWKTLSRKAFMKRYNRR
ncbi:hypothetical protein LRR81_07940 [Metabacillus sp. GX 13764]|uniref:hypothetical protein n=1 Tax=Metabacillus kandeliae TaxID=2900151 RepID=UPI001E4CF198|nr:hypothetical protein [Metabacillus kandeliae]MCD7034161.1 hypothetical protein [Metabacillus kandeliae]